MRWLKWGLLALVVGYVLVCVGFVVYAPRLQFPAPTPAPISAPEGMRVTDACGAPGVRCLFAPAAKGQPTAIFFHGNGRQLSDRVGLVEALHQSGLGVLAVEYPGYGGTPGAPSEKSLYAAAKAGIAYLRSVGVPREQTIVIGRSLGTGVATELAHAASGMRLILVSPFTSIPDVGARMFPWLPVRLLVRDRFENLGKAAAIDVPTLVLHGTADEEIPFEMGKTLAHRFPHGTLLPVAGAGHNDILEHPGVIEAIRRFARDGSVQPVSGMAGAVPRP